MIKQNKTKLLFILGAIFFVSIAVAACNSSESDKKTEVKDSVTVIKTDPAVRDSMDTGDVKPTPTPN